MKISFNFTVLVAAITLGFLGCDKPAPMPVTGSTVAATNAPAVAGKSNPELEKLKGKWERPDGGYILEIRSVDAEGKLDAGYFNPSPIKIARAMAYREGGESRIFVELQDVNYPGCTYKLTLDAKNDQLFGQYFQATMQQTFDVAFARLK